MKTYTETLTILDQFYKDCYNHWKREGGYGYYSIEELALHDIELVQNDPYSPQGEPLDQQAKKDFIESKQPR